MKSTPLKKSITNYIRPIRRKMNLERWVNWSGFILMAMAGVGLIITIVSRITPVPYMAGIMLGVMGAAFVVLFAALLIARPGFLPALRRTDQLLSKERLLTAWLFRETESHACQIQREETKDFMTSHPVKEVAYHWRMKTWPYKVFGGIVLLTVAVSMIKTSSTDEAKAIETFREKLAAEGERLEDSLEEKLTEADLTEEQKEQVKEILDSLAKELEKAKSEEEALKELSVAKNELKDMEQEALEKKLNEMKEQLEKLKEETEALSKENNNGENGLTEEEKKALEEQMAALQEAFEAMDEEALAQLMEQMTDMTMEDLEAAMEAMAQALETGDFQEALESMASLNNMLASGEMALSSMEGSLSELMAAINSAGNAMSDTPSLSQMAFAAVSGSSGNNLPGNQATLGTGNGASSSGSTNEDSGYEEEDANGALNKTEGSEDKQGTYEALNDSERIGGTSDPSVVEGQQLDQGETTYTQVKTIPTDTGELVGYSEVFASYHQEALERVDELEVPVVMKTIVRDYFTGLNEEED